MKIIQFSCDGNSFRVVDKAYFEANVLAERIFDCEPYDDQLRAYVYDNGKVITAIMIVGE